MTVTVESLPAVLAVADGVKEYPEHLAGGMVALDTVPGYDPRITVPPIEWNGINLTCQTCGGVYSVEDHCGEEWICAECVEGHPIIDVHVPCNKRHASMASRETKCHEWAMGRCDGTRTVSVSIQAVPIVDVTAWDDKNQCYWLRRGDGQGRLASKHQARPGQYAIVATEVTG